MRYRPAGSEAPLMCSVPPEGSKVMPPAGASKSMSTSLSHSLVSAGGSPVQISTRIGVFQFH
ncbi:hypothetical protein [Actinomadura verrucosospora]|nr:hypothetical protein [Actinomadura verrucosospora]